MNAIISLGGLVLSFLGMGTSTYSQVQTMRNLPMQQAQVQPYQQCVSGYGQIRQAPDGSYYIQCLTVHP